jgi:glycosyltransferase involved in cell wall biosynthesis
MRVLMITPELPTVSAPGSLAPLVRQIESLRAVDIQVDVLEVRGLPRLKYLQTLPVQYRRLPAVDLVHAHFGYCGWLARSQVAKPVVISFMGDDLLGTPDARGRIEPLSKVPVWVNRRLAHRVDAVIVKSAEMADVLAPVPAYIIPNGVDLKLFQPMDRCEVKRRLGWDVSQRYILFPGDPDNPRKGFSLAQEVVGYARQRLGTALELVPLWNVSPELVPFYMNSCDAMLMTSLIEGSPNVVKEAMACNLPVVSVTVGDVGELLSGLPGYHVCPRDATVLAAALVELLLHKQEVLGRLALEHKGLDLDRVAWQIRTVYESVLTRHVPV